ncbi:MAG TPA: metallophosphoesterase, partial [Terriglobales bacterium]
MVKIVRLFVILLAWGLFLSGLGHAQDFTIIALPDTQNEAQFDPNVLASQMSWIVANRTTLNIGVVLGEGDIVNEGASTAQMQNADAAYKLLDQAGIPYFAAIGNHDYDGADPKASRSAQSFNQWFGPARYAGRPFYQGNLDGSNENFYGAVTMGGKQFLILALEYYPRPASLAWGESILAANSGMEAIVVTHSYMFVDNTRVDRCDTADMPEPNANGDDMWAVFRKHPNVVMVV